MNASIYITRSIERTLIKAASQFPAVMLTGPRQSGKTTTLRRVFADLCNYVSLDAPDIRALALENPRGFLEAYPAPLIIDEVQYAPDLFPYIKSIIDDNRNRKGQYILTGSQNILLLERIQESLAGRIAILQLFTLSEREISGSPGTPLPWDCNKSGFSHGAGVSQNSGHAEIWKHFIRGNFPELIADPDLDTYLWHSSYVRTYLERDVPTVKRINDTHGLFNNFIRLLAAHSGNIINYSSLARDIGISVNTVRSWIRVLEATYQIVILQPYFENIGKRLIKNPKIYFTDTGTLCYLTGIKEPDQAMSGPLGGVIFETAVVSEIRKRYTHQGIESLLYFWRTAKGSEVDLFVHSGGKIIPVEISMNSTPRMGKVREMKKLMSDFGDRMSPGYLIHPGDIMLPMGDGIVALPWRKL